MNDPIVDEVRRVRDAHAARFDYDLDAIFRDIKEQERKSGLRFVAGAARQSQPKPVPQSHGPGRPVSPDSGPLDTASAAER
jgi:hypothetical protein